MLLELAVSAKMLGQVLRVGVISLVLIPRTLYIQGSSLGGAINEPTTLLWSSTARPTTKQSPLSFLLFSALCLACLRPPNLESCRGSGRQPAHHPATDKLALGSAKMYRV